MVKTGILRTNSNKGKPILFEKDGDCIICTSHAKTVDGYVRVYAGMGQTPRCKLLHRAVWETEKGEIPINYEIDHICRNRACCNIEHLQLLERSDHKSKGNLLRYAERISHIKRRILEGGITKEIALEFNVTTHTVARYKRQLKG